MALLPHLHNSTKNVGWNTVSSSVILISEIMHFKIGTHSQATGSCLTLLSNTQKRIFHIYNIFIYNYIQLTPLPLKNTKLNGKKRSWNQSLRSYGEIVLRRYTTVRIMQDISLFSLKSITGFIFLNKNCITYIQRCRLCD